ncbi:BRCT domain-containing protein [Pseudomonas sp. ES3-33]|uniref:BRCT domain-containing protein n=1 Tax=Pseudomonas sp. ES3-33 TaxID=1628833 RepID=UPI000697E99C|nr:BRCT domain-containing protein [Pseudomonas sp. ES3-33]
MAAEKDSLRLLSFSYRDSKGNVTERELTHWKETSVYIQGRAESDAFYRTFRKDRVIEYLCGAQHLSFDRAPPPPPYSKTLPTDVQGQILFTGFKSEDRINLENLAAANGLRVVKTPTKNLAFLCAGYNAGWTKIEAAVGKGAFILSEAQLLAMFQTGEISEVS